MVPSYDPKPSFRTFSNLVFRIFWPLDAGIEHFGPEIRILREISFPEPAGNGPAPESRSKSGQINFLMCFF